MIDTILFDLDGTLLYTLDDLHISVNHALHYHHMPLRSKEEILQFVGNGVPKLIQRAVPKGTSEAEEASILRIFRQHYLLHGTEHTRPYTGITTMLTAIKGMGYKIGVVSNKLHEATSSLCERFFPHLIDACVGMTEALRAKPSPDMPLRAMHLLQAKAANCVYVGDSDVDLLTAEAIGVKCLSVSWGFRTQAFLARCGAETFVHTPDDIIKWLQEDGGQAAGTRK